MIMGSDLAMTYQDCGEMLGHCTIRVMDKGLSSTKVHNIDTGVCQVAALTGMLALFLLHTIPI